jgi:hypothetical protein
MEWLTGLFGGLIAGYLLTWPALLGLVILGVVFEHRDHRGWAVFAGIVSMVVSYFYFDVPLTLLAEIAAAYIAIGFIWSFWRYKRFVRQGIEELKECWTDPREVATRAERFKPGKHVDTISCWVIIWPLSFIGCVTGDIIDTVGELIQRFFKGVYARIYASAVQDIMK